MYGGILLKFTKLGFKMFETRTLSHHACLAVASVGIPAAITYKRFALEDGKSKSSPSQDGSSGGFDFSKDNDPLTRSHSLFKEISRL